MKTLFLAVLMMSAAASDAGHANPPSTEPEADAETKALPLTEGEALTQEPPRLIEEAIEDNAVSAPEGDGNADLAAAE